MKYTSIYMLLGEKCNFNCAYCLQHDKFNSPCSSLVDLRVIDFLNSDKIERLEEKIRLVFWGGEPLLYFTTIKLLVKYLDPSKFSYSIISNGALLNEEMVSFINNHDIQITFSNDGPKTDNYRTENILENKEFLYLLSKLEQTKSFCSVISADNYDVRSIWKYIHSRVGRDAYINYDFILDTGCTPKTLTNFDFVSFDRYLGELFDNMKRGILSNSLSYEEATFLNSLVKSIGSFSSGRTPCGVATSVLNINCLGDVLLCHNSGEIIGNILSDSKEDILAVFNQKYNKYSCSATCNNCQAKTFCHSGCILVGNEARNSYYCEMKKILNFHLQDLIKETQKGVIK